MAPPKALLLQFRYLNELQQFISVNLGPQSSPAPCCNMLNPSPFSPTPGKPVELHKGSMWLETSEPSRVFFCISSDYGSCRTKKKGSQGTIQ